MRFEGFAGNGGVKRQLSAAADSGRLPHALLIEGEPGTGRRTLARLLARTFVCQAADSAGKPCGECPACRKALDGSHPDIEELGGEGGYKSFHIDVIRALRGSAQVLPNEAPVRVMILLNAQDMTPAAQNALLKLLEEPPAALRFILTADNRAALLPTVLSRCQCVALRGVEEREAVAALKERLAAAAADASAAEESGVPSGAGKAGRDKSGANKAAPPLSADDETLIRAVRLFGGNIGRALDILSDADLSDGTLQPVADAATGIARAILEPAEWELLRQTAALEKKEIDGVLAALALLCRDALVVQAGGTTRLSVSADTAGQLAAALPADSLYALLAALADVQAYRRSNMHAALCATVLCARMRAAIGK